MKSVSRRPARQRIAVFLTPAEEQAIAQIQQLAERAFGPVEVVKVIRRRPTAARTLA
jgi:hypothetical protein